MKKFKIGIIITIILIIIISSILLIMMKKENVFIEEGSDYGDVELEHQDFYEPKKVFEQVQIRNKYYAVEKIINTYVMYIKQMKGIINAQRFEDEKIKEEGASQLYSVLDDQYKAEMNIQEAKQLQAKINEYKDYNVQIQKMYIYEQSASINTYIVYFTIDNQETKLMIKTDSQNMTFALFLEDYIKAKEYSENMDGNKVDITDTSIVKNDFNQYNYINISDEYMATRYMDSLKENIVDNIEYTYNNLMEKEYKEKRFGNINNFAKYITENKNNFQNLELEKYLVNKDEDKTEYVCVDKFNNYYIFIEYAIMDYTFQLDTYTIETDKFKTTYDSADSYKKVQMNIDKFFQMINRQDYRTSYSYLANSFKSKNVKSEQDFENIVKRTFFKYNKVGYTSVDELGSNTYAYKITLTDLTAQDATEKNVIIIMRLLGDTNFEMSFSIE